MPSYSLLLLGQPVLQGPSGPIRTPASKAQALLWYLATQPEQVFSRYHLAAQFWPDHCDVDGRSRLNTTLTRLRQSLPIWPLALDGETIGWAADADVELDTLRFLQLVRRSGPGLGGRGVGGAIAADPRAEVGDLMAATALWRGPALLQGFDVQISSLYEEWLRQQRQVWERRMLESLGRLVNLLTGLGEGGREYGRVVAACQQALALDPLQERFHRGLMLALYQSGERAAALTQYRTCSQILQAELGVEPDAATTALRDQIAAGSLPRLVGEKVSVVRPEEPTAVEELDLAILSSWSGDDLLAVAGDPRWQAVGRLALTDSLTGLYNRRYIMARLEAEVATGRRPLVGLVSLEQFKACNDALGHERGDVILQACGAALKEELVGAVVARLGGAMFAVLFPHQSLEIAGVLLEQVMRRMPREAELPEGLAALQLRAGLAQYGLDGENFAALLSAADNALQAARRGRRPVALARDLDQSALHRESHSLLLSTALAGRETLWQRLQAAMRAAEAGAGKVLSLEGPAGSGKSQLMVELAATARRDGWRVVQVGHDQPGRPYRPFLAAAEGVCGPGGSLVDGAYSAAQQTMRAVQRLLEGESGDGPLLICIDDLHEAENLDALALLLLGWELPVRALLVVVSLRSDFDGTLDWELVQSVGVAADWLVREQVSGLDRQGTQRLAVAILSGLLSPAAVRSLHEITGGNPLHISQVLATWIGTGVLSPGPAGWVLQLEAAERAPRSLHQALLERVQQLDASLREFLGLAAVWGQRFTRGDLAALSGLGPEELVGLLDRAVAAGVLQVVGGDALGFAHPLLRQSAYSLLNLQTRRLAHRVAGQLLLESGSASAAELAVHFDGAGARVRAFAHHVQAGTEAMARAAHGHARRHFQRAWQLLPEAADCGVIRRAELARLLALATRAHGDARAAVELCREALQARHEMTQAEVQALLVQLAEAACLMGDAPQARAACQDAEALDAGAERLRLRALRMRLDVKEQGVNLDPVPIRMLAQEALALGEPAVAGSLLGLLGSSLLASGQVPGAARTMQVRAAEMLPVGGGREAAEVRLEAARSAQSFPEALRWCREGLAAAAAAGDAARWLELLHLKARLYHAAGQSQTARRFYEVSLQLARRRGGESTRDGLMSELGLLLGEQLGQFDEGIALAAVALDSAQARGDQARVSQARGNLARCLLAANQPREALAALPADWGAVGHAAAGLLPWIRVLALVMLGEITEAAAQVASGAEAVLEPEAAGLRALAMGVVARRSGDAAGALRLFEQVSHLAAICPYAPRYGLGLARGYAALALHTLGQETEGHHAMQQARQLLQQIGATHAIATLERLAAKNVMV